MSEHGGLRPILVADDDLDDREFLMFEFQQHKVANPVVYAADGDQVFQRLKGEHSRSEEPPVCLILLDYFLPPSGAIRVISNIRKEPGLADLPITVMLASEVEQEIVKSQNLDILGSIVKPVTIEKLSDLMERLTSCNLVYQP
jgi:CheY-like chemotaxis protein